jgi:hypothetical protein
MLMVTTFGPLPAHSYVTLIKLDSSGTMQWNKRFGPGDVRAMKIAQAPDSSYFFTALDWTAMNKHVYTRVDKNGNLIFSREYFLAPAFQQTGYGGLVVAKNNGGFYVSSTVHDSVNNVNSWHLLELDNQGNVLWSQIYSGGSSASYAIDTTANGDIVLAGSMVEPLTYKEFAVILRTDSSGGIRWYKCYKTQSEDIRAMSADIDNNGNIYATAPSDPFASPGNSTFLMKVDSSGNPVWANRYLTNMGVAPNFVRVTTGQEVVVAGLQHFMKVDTAGQPVCSRKHQQLWMHSFDMLTSGKYTYSGMSWTTGGIVFYTSDSCGKTCLDSAMSYSIVPIVIYDSTLAGRSPMSYTSSSYLLPTDTVTIYPQLVCTIVSVPENQAAVRKPEIYPSPANDILHIVTPASITSAQLVSSSGQTIGIYQSDSGELDIHVAQLANGIYFLQVMSNGELSQTKFIVMHE